jgi:hypothetical protein
MNTPSQNDRLYALLKDGEPHRTDEILEKVYGNDHLALARVGARIYDIKKKHRVEVKGWKDAKRPALYWYQLVETVTEPPRMPQETPEAPNRLFALPEDKRSAADVFRLT